jgi:L-fuculose-phosphate aldolase
MPSRDDIARQLVSCCHRLYERGLVVAADGNVSARLPNGTILITPTGVSKGRVEASDLVEITLDGTPVDKRGKPSTEVGMHVFIYERRKDVGAIVHAHPPYATGFATARIALEKPLLPEVILGLGSIPLAPYATPSTREVAESLAPFVERYSAILLANHGVVVMGRDIDEASLRMEKVEHAAHTTFVAHLLGGAHTLTQDEVEKLRAVGSKVYGRTDE